MRTPSQARSRFVRPLIFLAVILASLFFANSASAGATSLTCNVPYTAESFDCNATVAPSTGNYEFDVTFTGDVTGQNAVQNAWISLRCPSATTSGQAPPYVFRPTGLPFSSSNEAAFLGQLSANTVSAQHLGGQSYSSGLIPISGNPYVMIEGTWGASSATVCQLHIMGVLAATAYGQNQEQVSNHSDLTYLSNGSDSTVKLLGWVMGALLLIAVANVLWRTFGGQGA